MSPEQMQDMILQLQDELQYRDEELQRYKVALQGGQYADQMPKNKDERWLERLLKQKLGDNQHASGHNLWLTRSDLVEILALLNVSAKDYRKFCRDWEDITALAQGGGNDEIVKTEQESFFFRLQLYRSRGDNPVAAYTTLSSTFTNRQEVDQTVNMPKQQEQSMGLMDIFKPRKRV